MLNGRVVSKALAILIVGVAGWSETALAKKLDPLTPTELQSRLQDFAHDPWNGSASESDRNGGDCRESKVKLEVRDPLTKEKRFVDVVVVRPSSVAKVPAVLVVPSVEGVTAIEPKIASQLCHAGLAAVIADVVDTSLPKSLPAIGHEDIQQRRAILALRTILDLVSNHPAFDRDRIGIIGVSLGGVITSMFAGIEPDRLKAVVIVVGGGNLPFVLATSDQAKVSDLRRQRMEYLKVRNPEQYEDWLRGTLRYDPLYFAPLANRDRIMMITARNDSKVPYSVQQDLFEAYGRPKVSQYSGGHVETIIKMTYFYFGEVIDFYKDRLGLASAFVPEVITH